MNRKSQLESLGETLIGKIYVLYIKDAKKE